MKTFNSLGKETQIILAVTAAAVAIYAADKIATGFNQAEANVGEGIGLGAALAGLGVLAWFVI